MQVVCDVDGRIIATHIGNPGSCGDSNVFQRMDLFRDPGSHFCPGQFLLADSAYGLSQNCIPAFKSPAADLPENTAFNYCLARSRVRVEHCIGILKGRWSSLKEMRQQIRNDGDMMILVKWVLSCCVLHNMLAEISDEWTELFADKEPPHFELCQEPATLDAITFRTTILKTTLETNIAKGVLESGRE